MTPMNPNILREKFDIPPEMTLNVYHVKGVNANLLNGFNYFQPSKSEEEHIHFIKQRFEIPDNIKVSSDYFGNSMIDISCEEGSPAFNDQHHLVLPPSDKNTLDNPKHYINSSANQENDLVLSALFYSTAPLLSIHCGSHQV